MKRIFFLFIIVGIIFPTALAKGEVTIPHIFESGNPAKAREVNENFQALKTTIESQEQQSFSGTYTLPFSASGALADRNVLVLKDIGAMSYIVRINFCNSEGFTISTNGYPTFHDYIQMWIYVNTDSTGNITYLNTFIDGMDTPYGDTYTAFQEISYYDPSDLSIVDKHDKEKYSYKCLNPLRQSVPYHCVLKFMLSADNTLTGLQDNSYINSLLGESIELNGMTFSDVMVQTSLCYDRIRLRARDIGLILSRRHMIIYYRVNGASGGDLTGTPFASGGYLEGLFFSP